MPFVYDFDTDARGHDELGSDELDVASRRLRPVLLLPSTAGYFSATKAECVSNASGVATDMRVFLPGSSTPLMIALPAGGGGFGVSVISYCLPEAGGPRPASGDQIDVSPIERRPPACIHEHEDPKETEQEIETRVHRCEAQSNATVESYRTAGGGKRPAWEEK